LTSSTRASSLPEPRIYAIVGSGFGLFGYLPALVERLGATVALPRAYEAKARARPELARAMEGVRWVDDRDAALACADAVVIATPPARQLEVAAQCLALPSVRRIVLEKPVAPEPGLAARLLQDLERAGKRYRVGYTLAHSAWASTLAWPRRGEVTRVNIQWTFMAHHFAHGLANWKRSDDSGGGVLRFFGVHVLALLVRHGYRRVGGSQLTGASPTEPERWTAAIEGDDVPPCVVEVDSRSEARRFRIASDAAALVDLDDPFARETVIDAHDRRVGVLERLLRTFAAPDALFQAWYAATNDLWREAETR
jgi:hypothetical protein